MRISSLFRLTALSAVTFSLAAAAQSFPTKPITIIVPFAAGGTADQLARASGEILKNLGQPVVVDNKPGAGGSLGVEHVVRSQADGHTLVLTTSGIMAINPHVYKLRYKPTEDLASVTMLVDAPFVFVANPSTGIKTLDDLRRAAQAKPGVISSGNAGSGTQAHLTQELLQKAAGIQLNVISYKGNMPGVNDLLGGQIDTMIDNIGLQATYVAAGKVAPLFVTSTERVKALPNVPTAQEAGLPGFSSVAWYGLAAPKGTPAEVVNKIQQALAKGFAQPELRAKLEGQGLIPVANKPADATARANKDFDTFGTLAKQLDLKPM
jgi:tripartite-type tricarboxylate transporter receptor subunit TctC